MDDRRATIEQTFAAAAEASGFPAAMLMVEKRGPQAASAWRKAAAYVLVRVLHVPQQQVAAAMQRSAVYEMVNEYRWAFGDDTHDPNHPSLQHMDNVGKRARVEKIVLVLSPPDPCPTVTLETVVDE